MNLMLCRDTQPSEFVTLFYGVLDARNRRLTYSNAGHPPPLLRRDGQITELPTSSMVLGIDPSEAYTQAYVDLRSGDTLLLYTDGLPDARNFNDESFGRQRVLEAFSRATGSAETVSQSILWEMRRFAGLTKRTDDVTMIVVQMK
jgi:sigma-B regulation protein RsbU (phosphoserine phosphatase)